MRYLTKFYNMLMLFKECVVFFETFVCAQSKTTYLHLLK